MLIDDRDSIDEKWMLKDELHPLWIKKWNIILMDELHSWMNDDVAADVDASGWWTTMGCHFWQWCATPEYYGDIIHETLMCPPPHPKLFLSYPIGWTQYLSMDGLDDGVQFFIPKDSPQMIGLHAAD